MEQMREMPLGGRGPGWVQPGASIEVVGGFYDGLEVPIDHDRIVIGRGRGADLMIAEPTISRAHAAIGFGRDGFFVEDLGSTNGTFVNGSRHERHVLTDGDEVQMGRLRLRIRLPAPGP